MLLIANHDPKQAVNQEISSEKVTTMRYFVNEVKKTLKFPEVLEVLFFAVVSFCLCY